MEKIVQMFILAFLHYICLTLNDWRAERDYYPNMNYIFAFAMAAFIVYGST